MKIPHLTGQVLRFVIIGVSNTAVDFLVLNGLMLIFGLTAQDPRFTLFKIISFSIALANSFIWNRLWVFRKEAEKKHERNPGKEAAQFFFVSLFSFIVNIGVSTLVYQLGYVYYPEFSPVTLANLGALTGSVTAFASNFLGYKFIVFRPS
jgi:putative flippase GtrA